MVVPFHFLLELLFFFFGVVAVAVAVVVAVAVDGSPYLFSVVEQSLGPVFSHVAVRHEVEVRGVVLSDVFHCGSGAFLFPVRGCVFFDESEKPLFRVTFYQHFVIWFYKIRVLLVFPRYQQYHALGAVLVNLSTKRSLMSINYRAHDFQLLPGSSMNGGFVVGVNYRVHCDLFHSLFRLAHRPGCFC